MTIFDHIRATTGVYDTHAELVRLQDTYDTVTDTHQRAGIALRIAQLAEAEADLLESSGMARAMASSLLTPASLRAEADEWRQRAQQTGTAR